MTESMSGTSAMCRKRRVDWAGKVLDAGWMALMLSCTGECVYRLLWAVRV